jgi:TatD DNase family protein
MLIETHAHLDYPDFQPDFLDVLQRAKEAGIGRLLSVGTSLESSRRVVELASQHECVYAVVGIHPNSVVEEADDAVDQLRSLAQHPKVVAIGETGLDYYRLPIDEDQEAAPNPHGFTVEAIKQRQAVFFRRQLDLAVELGLNVVVHERSAWEDTLALLHPYTGRVRAVFHCFGKSIEEARQLLAMNHLVSFTGIVTFKNAPLARETARQIPGNGFMVETDCPYLAPIPFRGKRCEPAYTRIVAETIAGMRGESLEAVAEQTTKNALDFFRF